MCQTCIDDGIIAESIYLKVEDFLDSHPSAEFGPAHIVLADCNVLDGHIKWCIGLAKAALSKDVNDLHSSDDVDLMNRLDWYSDDDPDEIRATIKFLEELLEIPEDER